MGASAVDNAGPGLETLLVPPVEKLVCRSLSLWCPVLLEKINDKLVEFFIIEPVVVAHPMGGVVEREVKLG